jgi:hypothetical protein
VQLSTGSMTNFEKDASDFHQGYLSLNNGIYRFIEVFEEVK